MKNRLLILFLLISPTIIFSNDTKSLFSIGGAIDTYKEKSDEVEISTTGVGYSFSTNAIASNGFTFSFAGSQTFFSGADFHYDDYSGSITDINGILTRLNILLGYSPINTKNYLLSFVIGPGFSISGANFENMVHTYGYYFGLSGLASFKIFLTETFAFDFSLFYGSDISGTTIIETSRSQDSYFGDVDNSHIVPSISLCFLLPSIK